MTNKRKKILVHVCCAACASYVFSELEKDDLEIVAYFYNPQAHGIAEYKRRLKDVDKLCESKGIELIVPDYDIQDFFSLIMPFQGKNSIKYITDKNRYRRKRCQLCISLIVQQTANCAKKMKLKIYTTTQLCSPYKDHNEVWDVGLECATNHKIDFFYKDFRKGYWTGRNYARSHDIIIPNYCGCSESLEEGRLE